MKWTDACDFSMLMSGEDRQSVESPFRIEPAAPGEPIGDVVAAIAAASAALGSKLAPRTAASLAALVRLMNCSYSNLIEGHHTRPRDIERALAQDLDADDDWRALQLEARAHVRVQGEIDGCGSVTARAHTS
jgi:Fic family protein